MKMKELPLRNLFHKPLRTAALFVLTFFLAFTIFSGSAVIWSLQNGLDRLESRLGADVIVVPNKAKQKIDPKNLILNGTPGYFYMNKEKMNMIEHVEGVDKVSPQIFLASLSASCCSIPVQIIGFDPESDFIVQPWIQESYHKPLEHGDVVVGASIVSNVGDTIRFYNQNCHIVAKLQATGTGLDTAVYTNADTIRSLIDASAKMGVNQAFDGDVNDIISSVYIKVKDGYSAKKVTDNINLQVRRVKAIQMKEMLSEIGTGLTGVSRTIGFLIGSIWVMAFIILAISFSVLVGERKKEFAVLRMLGMSQKRLASVMLAESFILSFIGGLAGVFMGLLTVLPFGSYIETVLHLPFLIPGWKEIILLTIGTVVVICVVGPLAAGYATLRLSRVDAATIFREGN